MESTKIKKQIVNIKENKRVLNRIPESQYHDWQTPPEFVTPIIKGLGQKNFDTDVCCTVENIPAKVYLKKDGTYYQGEKINNNCGLLADWQGVCWMNPPYGADLKLFVEKVNKEIVRQDVSFVSVIGLLPVRTENKYYHDLVFDTAFAVYFLQGKNLEFLINGEKFDGEHKNAPQKLMLVFWNLHVPRIISIVSELDNAGFPGTLMTKA